MFRGCYLKTNRIKNKTTTELSKFIKLIQYILLVRYTVIISLKICYWFPIIKNELSQILEIIFYIYNLYIFLFKTDSKIMITFFNIL